MHYALRIDHVVLDLGERRLLEPGFTMSVGQGQMACLRGESGCGKTSLLKACLGLVDVVQGSIEVDGKKVRTATLADVRRRVAYLPQELALPIDTVREMVELPFSLAANAARRDELKRLPELLERLGLEPELLDRQTNSLSGGQRQRIMLATVTLLGKRLLLLDEPTSALDAEAARLAADFVRDYCETTGAAALVVSHDSVLAEISHERWTLK